MKFFASALACALLLCTPLSAATVLYDESADGDLTFPTLVTRSISSAGTFLVSGSTTRGFGGAAGDIDEFLLSLGAGLRITSASASLSSFSSTGNIGTNSPTLQLANTDSGFNTIFRQHFAGTTPTSSFSNLPAGGSDFRMSVYGGCGGCSGPVTYTFDWTLEITTRAMAAVPLPASLPMLLSLIAGLGLLRTRRRTD